MTLPEAFRILGVRPSASESEIQRAYRDLVKVWHPDRFREDAALAQKADEKLKEINEAYQALKSLPRPSFTASRPAQGRQPFAGAPQAGRGGRSKGTSFTSEGRWVSWLALLIGILVFGWAWYQAQSKTQPSDVSEKIQNIT